MDSVTRILIIDESGCSLHRANALGKDMNVTIFAHVMNK